MLAGGLEKWRAKLRPGWFVKRGEVSGSSTEGQDAKNKVLTALTCGLCKGEWLRTVRTQYAQDTLPCDIRACFASFVNYRML